AWLVNRRNYWRLSFHQDIRSEPTKRPLRTSLLQKSPKGKVARTRMHRRNYCSGISSTWMTWSNCEIAERISQAYFTSPVGETLTAEKWRKPFFGMMRSKRNWQTSNVSLALQ